MALKPENLRIKVKEAAMAVLALSIMLFFAGCAEFMTNDPRRFTDADYSRAEAIDTDNALKTEKKTEENEPALWSIDWSIKYRAQFKILYTGLFAGLAMSGEESNKGIAVPLSALIGYGIASFPMSWEKDGNWYKWPVIGGAAAGLTAGIVMIVQDKLYEGQYGWEGLICFGTAVITTIIGTGVGGIAGDIANAVDIAGKNGK